MTALTLAPWKVTLGTYELQVVSGPGGGDQPDTFGYSGRYESQDPTQALTRRDVVINHLNRFDRGCGIITRRDASDDGHLGWSENGYSHLRNGLYPGAYRNSGALTSTLTQLSGVGAAVIDSRPFVDGYRYFITNGGWVFRYANDDPGTTGSGGVATIPAYSPVLNSGAWANPGTSLRAGYVCTAIETFQGVSATGKLVPAVVVYAYSSAVPATRVYQYTIEDGWTESAAFTTIKITQAVAPVWWEGTDGAGAQRLLVACADLTGGDPATTHKVANIIKQVPLGSDLKTEANYTAPITTDPSADVSRLLAFPQFAFAMTKNGLWTFNALRSMNVTPYAKLGSSYGDNGVAALYNGGIVMARGFGADFYNAGEAYRRQDAPVEVGPTAYFQDGIPIRGQITAMVQHEQWLIMALYNHENKTTYIGRAAPRDVLGINGIGPWAQYWAEHVIPSSGGSGQQVTHMALSAPTVTASAPVLKQRALKLWLFTADEPFSGTSNCAMQYADMPVGGGPLSLQASSGTFHFTTSGSSFYLPSQNWDDDTATKYIRQIDGQNYLQSKTLQLYTRTDANPTTITTIGTWASNPSITTDSYALKPSTEVSGKQVGLLAILTTDNAAIGPILRSVSPRAKVVRTTFDVRTIWVVLEKDYELEHRSVDLRDVDTTAAGILALQDFGQQDYLDEFGTSRKVLVEQGIAYRKSALVGINGRNELRTLLQLEITVVS